MYPYLLQSMAVEHVKGLRREATAAARFRRARSVRAGTRARAAASGAGARIVRRAVQP